MSWAEVKKINDDMTTPLDILAGINNIALIGTGFNPLSDLDYTAKLTKSSKLYVNTAAMGAIWQQVYNNIFTRPSEVGSILSQLLWLNDATLEAIGTWSEVLASTYCVDLLGNDDKFCKSVWDSGFTLSYIASKFFATSSRLGRKLFLYQYPISATATIDAYIQNNTIYTALLADTAAQFVERATFSYTIPTGTEKLLVIAIGAGGNMTNTSNCNGGACTHSFYASGFTVGQNITGEITSLATTVQFQGGATIASLGAGGGTSGTQSQSGKLIRISTAGGTYADYGYGGTLTGGGGGWGGGNGALAVADAPAGVGSAGLKVSTSGTIGTNSLNGRPLITAATSGGGGCAAASRGPSTNADWGWSSGGGGYGGGGAFATGGLSPDGIATGGSGAVVIIK